LKSLFSPSHEVDVVREDDHTARVGFEKKNIKPDKDFILYIATSREPFGAALVTSKEKTQDGYYALFVAPRYEVSEADIIPKDVVFVIDTSGSMKEPARKPWKIDQAKGALKFCINSLNPKDRFNIVAFATGARSFRSELQPVNNDTREEATEFIHSLEASGGTNIHEALHTTLAMQKREASRPFIIVFLTDGQPTVGELQKAEDLVRFVRKEAGPETRLFVFGVGYDVNTHLLDKMALENRGDRIYVSPEENLEVKVSGFYDKIAFPVMSDVEVIIDGIESYDTFPTQIPDLFRGSQLVLYGRYRGSGHAAIRVKGMIHGKSKEFIYEGSFPDRSGDHENIPCLWATTKIGYLLDQLRLKGINVASGQKPSGPEKELVEEIVSLATRFGIVTPYTALLVLEDTKERGRPPTPAARRMLEAREENEAVASSLNAASEGFYGRTGKAALDASKTVRRLQKKAIAGGIPHSDFARAIKMDQSFKRVADKTFILVNHVWYDSVFKEGMSTQRITFLSEEYFALISKHPKLAKYLSVGDRVVVCLDGNVYEITS
jgi:Ca-activated chloride channel family protein